MTRTLRDRARDAAEAGRATGRNLVYRATAVLLAVVALMVGGVLWAYWSSIYKDAQVRDATLAYLLAEQTTRTFQAVDLTLAGLAPVYAASLPDHADAFGKLLAQRVSEVDFIDALYVVDEAGHVTQASGAAGPRLQGAAARSDLDAFAQDPSLQLLIGQPLFSSASVPAPSGTLGAVPVMRRLTGASGQFAGMLVASVEPRYFSDFYRNLDLGRRGSIDLYQDNGAILLASNSDAMPSSAVMRHGPETPTFDLASTVGNVHSSGTVADQRLIAFHRAGRYPLVVAVGIDLADLQLRWWRIAAPSLVALLAIIGLAIALAATVSRRLEERRRARSRAMTMQKLEALGQMTASVSHDFRNILAVMTATLHLVRKRGPDETVLRTAEEAVERGTSLVTQLLAFSKRDDLQIRTASLDGLIEGLARMLHHAAGPEVALRFDLAGDLPPCRADQTQFDAALMNLVVNARQAMPGGGQVTVATRLAASGGVAVTVADTGSGIAPADLRRVFEPFFTTKAEGGTGLGLAQVYSFMRRIGGDVTVDSAVGVGTTFTLLFPLADPVPLADDRPAA